MRIEAITPVIGATISGADLGNARDIDNLKEALWEHQVVVMRDQPELAPQEQVALGRAFGELHMHPAAPQMDGYPEVFVIHADEHSKIANGNGWHTDVSCDEQPPLATILQLHTVPPAGGDTLFASMVAAFETLTPAMQAFLASCSARHESEHIYRGRYAQRGVDDTGRAYPSAIHPVVRTHPQSGRQALYVNPSFTTCIEGLHPSESRAMLSMLFKHQQRAEFQMRLTWQKNTIAIWDNRCTQHFALWDYWPQTRSGRRVTVLGERPIFHPGRFIQRKMRLSSARL